MVGCRCSGRPRQPSELPGSDGGRDGRGNGVMGQLPEDLELDSAQSMGVVSKTRGTGQPRPSCLAFTCLRSLSETTSCDRLACLGGHATATPVSTVVTAVIAGSAVTATTLSCMYCGLRKRSLLLFLSTCCIIGVCVRRSIRSWISECHRQV